MISTFPFHICQPWLHKHLAIRGFRRRCFFVTKGFLLSWFKSCSLTSLALSVNQRCLPFYVHLWTMLLNVSCNWIICCLGPCDNNKPTYSSEAPRNGEAAIRFFFFPLLFYARSLCVNHRFWRFYWTGGRDCDGGGARGLEKRATKAKEK